MSIAIRINVYPRGKRSQPSSIVMKNILGIYGI